MFRQIEAARRGGPEVLAGVDRPLRDAEAGEVRIRVEAAGVLLADVMWQRGMVPGSPKPPFVPGYDIVGRVDQVGDGVSGVVEGDRVAALTQYGGYTEYAYVSSDRSIGVPASVDPVEAICLTVGYLTAWQIFTRVANLSNGQRVLIHAAAGATGTAMLDTARLLGLEAFGTASEPKHDVVRSYGALPIDYRTDDFVDRVLEMTDGLGVDLVVDPIGGGTLKRSFAAAAKKGTVVSTAIASTVFGDSSRLAGVVGLLSLFARNLAPGGRKGVLFDVVRFNEKNPGFYSGDLTHLMGELAAGNLSPLVDRQLPLSKAREAQEALLRRETTGKVVLVTPPVG